MTDQNQTLRSIWPHTNDLVPMTVITSLTTQLPEAKRREFSRAQGRAFT